MCTDTHMHTHTHTYTHICCCCYLVDKSYLTLCHPTNCSQPASSVHGISQERILKWVTISFSEGSTQPRDQTHISCIGQRISYHWSSKEVLGFSCGSAGKESAYNAEDLGSIPGLKIPWRRRTLPIPVFWPGEFHGLNSPWGGKESDTTEQLSLSEVM